MKGARMTMEERLTILERELTGVKGWNRRLTGALVVVAGMAILAGFALLTAMPVQAQAEPADKTIKTSHLILESAAGKMCAELVASDTEGTLLHMYDKAGQERILLKTDEKDGPALVFYDKGGQRRIGFAATQDTSAIVLLDKQGQSKITLTASTDLNAVILGESESKLRAALGFKGKTSVSLQLYDQQNKLIWTSAK
jgi:hypothetical protein